MRIETIRLKNFKVFEDVEITNIPAYMVLLGPNGSGKSTLFNVFTFLQEALNSNVRVAVQKIGTKYTELVTRGHEKEDIEIEIQFRLDISGAERLVTYLLCLGLEENKPVIRREILRYKRGRNGSPYHFLDFSSGIGKAVTNEDDFTKTDEKLNKEDQSLGSPDILAVKALGQLQRFKAASALRQMLENWHISDFHINLARGSKEPGYAEHLSTSGDNLQLVAQYIKENHPDVFASVLEKMTARVPGVNNVEAADTGDGRIMLKFNDSAFKDPFIDLHVSDGTIKMFAYLLLLHDPTPHKLLCVEEPENQLYPHLLGELAEEFEDYANRGGQVFVSTHSPDFLNEVPLESIFWLEKRNGVTRVCRASEDENIRSLVEAGDKPGWLWKQGLLGGAF
ncbi:MAG: AAA family ATPase [Desulfovibrio sp.]